MNAVKVVTTKLVYEFVDVRVVGPPSAYEPCQEIVERKNKGAYRTVRSGANARGTGVDSSLRQLGAPASSKEAMLTLYYIVIFVILSVLYYISRRSSDPYGTFHLSFNKVPGSPDPPRTEWLNMGLWKVPQCIVAPLH